MQAGCAARGPSAPGRGDSRPSVTGGTGSLSHASRPACWGQLRLILLALGMPACAVAAQWAHLPAYALFSGLFERMSRVWRVARKSTPGATAGCLPLPALLFLCVLPLGQCNEHLSTINDGCGKGGRILSAFSEASSSQLLTFEH